MKWILSFLLISAAPLAFSQVSQQGERRDNPEYQAQGRLLTVRIVPGSKSAKIFLAGNKAADVNLSKDHKVLEITATNPRQQQKEILQFSKEGDSYVINKMPEWKEPYELNVKTETHGQIEEHKVQMKAPKKP